MVEEKRLLMFTGTECTHCHEMNPLVEQLQREHKLKVEKLEVWHNAENMAFLQKLDDGRCGGIPFFYNEKSGRWICGNVKYEKLMDWALS